MMEWVGWFLTLPLTGWLIKEVITNISQTRYMRKQSENEYQYFKKRLIFEQKHEIYKEVYKRLKHMVGVMNDLQYFDDRILSKNQDAVNCHVFYSKADDENFDSQKFVDEYNSSETTRLKINLIYNEKIMEGTYLSFKNYVSEQNYILTSEENTILNEIDTCRNEIIEYITRSYNYFDDNNADVVEKFRHHFSETYKEKFIEIDELTYRFSDTIRKEMFL